MESVVVAMGILMWMWAAVVLQGLRRLLPVAGPAGSAWLVLLVLVGGGALVALAQLVLPASPMSQGWSRETLSAAQQWTTGVVALAAFAGIVRGHRLLNPVAAAGAAGSRPAAARPSAAPASPATRRRP